MPSRSWGASRLLRDIDTARDLIAIDPLWSILKLGVGNRVRRWIEKVLDWGRV